VEDKNSYEYIIVYIPLNLFDKILTKGNMQKNFGGFIYYEDYL